MKFELCQSALVHRSRLIAMGYRTLNEIASSPTADLSRDLGCGMDEANSLKLVATSTMAGECIFTTLNQYRADSSRIVSTGFPQLDCLLGGGMRPGTCTELYGPIGSGKTQICFHAAALAVLPVINDAFPSGDLSSEVLFIDTEGTFVGERIAQIILDNYPNLEHMDEDRAGVMLEMFLTRIHYLPVLGFHDFSRLILGGKLDTVLSERSRV
eukprot:Partr_v1_DN28810_c2_g1_i1_m34264 putative DNA repair protein rad51